MSKKGALDICKNLTITINKMKSTSMRYEDTPFEKGTVSKYKLKTIRSKLMKKYKFEIEDLL